MTNETKTAPVANAQTDTVCAEIVFNQIPQPSPFRVAIGRRFPHGEAITTIVTRAEFEAAKHDLCLQVREISMASKAGELKATLEAKRKELREIVERQYESLIAEIERLENAIESLPKTNESCPSAPKSTPYTDAVEAVAEQMRKSGQKMIEQEREKANHPVTAQPALANAQSAPQKK